MGVAYVKNGIVNMLWEAEGFFESKTSGFIAATHIYDGKVVCFKDGRAFILIENDKPLNRNKIFKLVRDCHMNNEILEDYLQDFYVELSNGVEHNDTAMGYYGFTGEHIADIDKRLEDLYPYWEVIEVGFDEF